MKPNLMDINAINRTLEGADPAEILRWAWETFGSEVALTSSFQSQSLPLLHIVSLTVPQMPVLFVDTGFHFPETLAFRDQLARQLNLNIRNLRPKVDGGQLKRQREGLYHQDPDLCCYINKVKPLQDAKKNLKAWITGIRRDQTAARADTPVLSLDQDGLYKICPMVAWTREDTWSYIHQHQLPTHPLLDQGYMSIGCAPCTRPVFDSEDERSGRWPGQSKTECGLHLPITVKDRNGDS